MRKEVWSVMWIWREGRRITPPCKVQLKFNSTTSHINKGSVMVLEVVGDFGARVAAFADVEVHMAMSQHLENLNKHQLLRSMLQVDQRHIVKANQTIGGFLVHSHQLHRRYRQQLR
jgi:hypothetical protein